MIKDIHTCQNSEKISNNVIYAHTLYYNITTMNIIKPPSKPETDNRKYSNLE